MYCQSCGAKIKDGADFCVSCGAAVIRNRNNSNWYQNNYDGNSNEYGSNTNRYSNENAYSHYQSSGQAYNWECQQPQNRGAYQETGYNRNSQYQGYGYQQQYGYQGYNQQPASMPRRDDALCTLVKVFMILGCVSIGWLIIPLAWCIPMTVSVFKKLKSGESISTGLKVCSLLFVNLIAGVLMLCIDE